MIFQPPLGLPTAIARRGACNSLSAIVASTAGSRSLAIGCDALSMGIMSSAKASACRICATGTRQILMGVEGARAGRCLLMVRTVSVDKTTRNRAVADIVRAGSQRCHTDMQTLVSVVISLLFLIGGLIVIEVLRRKGFNPVMSIADMIVPRPIGQ